MHRHRGYAAFLFDMDGTVLSSIEASERVWRRWAEGRNLDPDSFMSTIHGVRAVETIAKLQIPGVDPVREAEEITRLELQDLEGVHAIPGAEAFLRSLPPDRWAIVTSAPRELAEARLTAAGLPIPTVLVTADDVSVGKPAPDGYLAAAARLGTVADECLVFEDAPAGIEAGEAANAGLIIITETHTEIRDYSHQKVSNYKCITTIYKDGLLYINKS